MAMTQCRHFSGYKPCNLNDSCQSDCRHFQVGEPRILIIHLDALGAVLRATAILPAIKRKFPNSHVTWVTRAPADKFFLNNHQVDRVIRLDASTPFILKALSFNLALVIDKSIEASGILNMTNFEEVRGFVADPMTGHILPANAGATELWEIGLSDHKKFFENKKPETQLLIEALDLGPFSRDKYQITLSESEIQDSKRRRREWVVSSDFILGINTGCSDIIPYKKWTVDYHRKLIQEVLSNFNCRVVLLGGPEDQARNRQIAEGLDVVSSPTQSGIRDGLVSTAACDLVVSGDSLGMHMAIALEKFVIAWFGPTCAHEIDLYDNGIKLMSSVGCSPCWKRSCQKTEMCYDKVASKRVIDAIKIGFAKTIKMSSRENTREPSHQSAEL